jgi:hypothetical protein
MHENKRGKRQEMYEIMELSFVTQRPFCVCVNSLHLAGILDNNIQKQQSEHLSP